MEIYTGIQDLGTPEQKAKLYQARELIGSAGAPVSLSETEPTRWKTWLKRNQAGSSSCVYQAVAKAAGILREQATGEFVEYSASGYPRRSNFPGEGSFPIEVMDGWVKNGIGLEALEPSQGLSELQMNQLKQSTFEAEVARISALKAYYALPGYDFDFILITLKVTGKPIPVGFFGSTKEWNQDVPTITDPGLTLDRAGLRHEVTATPNFGIYKGQEGFTIEDSWGTTGIKGMGVRWITRAFFERRNYIPGLVPTTFKSYEDIGVNPAKPKVKLTRDLGYGDQGEDVRALQTVLKFEGFFPANHPGSDLFLEITQRGVQQYQAKYGIVSAGSPATTGYGRVGPQTRADINTRYK